MANKFARNLKILRKISGKSQAELALIVNKGQTTIGNWETGMSEPNMEEMILLSNFFGVSLNDFLIKELTHDLETQNMVNEDPVPYKTQCQTCDMKDEIITALKGQVEALEKAVQHAEARLAAMPQPIAKKAK